MCDKITPAIELELLLKEISKKFKINFESLDIDGCSLDVLNIENMPQYINNLMAKHSIRAPLKDLPLWAKIWPASFVLGRFLRKFDTKDKSLIELGAGMGICAMIASSYQFDHILATDINQDALNFARTNILKNNLYKKIQVKYLDVHNPNLESKKFDFICASELLYLNELHRPLLKFIDSYLADYGKAVFCIDLARNKPDFTKLANKKFKVQQGNIGVKSKDEASIIQRYIYQLSILEKK